MLAPEPELEPPLPQPLKTMTEALATSEMKRVAILIMSVVVVETNGCAVDVTRDYGMPHAFLSHRRTRVANDGYPPESGLGHRSGSKDR